MPNRSAWNSSHGGLGWEQIQQVGFLVCLIGLALIGQIFLSSSVQAQFDGRPLGHSYVINAPLPSRSITLFKNIDQSGDVTVGKSPLAQLSDDTEVDKFQSTVDGWAYVRVVETGQEGWAKEMVDGVRHITCCTQQGTDSADFPAPGTFEQLGDDNFDLGKRILLVKKITKQDFLFTLSVGVKGIAIQCDETLSDCLRFSGLAIRKNNSYVYKNTLPLDGSVQLQILNEDEVSVTVDNLRVPKAMATQKDRIAGNYRRDRGVGVEASYVGFKMPSGNIICYFATDPDYLECQIRGHQMSFPHTDCKNPGFDNGYPGRIFRIEIDSMRGQPGCLTDQFYFLQMFNAVPYLQYGDTWRKSDFTCRSERTGLTCSNSGGHGFFLSRALQKVF